MSGPQKLKSIEDYMLAFFARAAGVQIGNLLPAPDPEVLMTGSVAAVAPAVVLGRRYHSAQVTGLAAGQVVQIKARNTATATPVQIGTSFTTDGLQQLPTGAYYSIEAALTTPGGSQLNGALLGGETTVVVDSTADFPASGAALIGTDRFTYTGKTGTDFTGVPATGDGSVGAHLDNAPVVAANAVVYLVSFR